MYIISVKSCDSVLRISLGERIQSPSTRDLAKRCQEAMFDKLWRSLFDKEV